MDKVWKRVKRAALFVILTGIVGSMAAFTTAWMYDVHITSIQWQKFVLVMLILCIGSVFYSWE